MAFHLHRDGKAVEFPIDELRAMARRGDLAQDEYVYDDTKGEWLGAAVVPELDGAWNIEESEATVAMQLPADFFDNFDSDAPIAAAGGVDDPTTRHTPSPNADEVAARAAPAAPAAAPPAPAPPTSDEEEATRAMDLSELQGAMAPSTNKQADSTAAIDSPVYEAEQAPPRPSPRPRQPRAPARPQAAMAQRSVGKVVNPLIAALLGLFTCGIYPLIWLWKRGEEVNRFTGREALPRWAVPAIVGAVIVFGGSVGALTAGLGAPVGPGLAALFVAAWGYRLGETVAEMATTSRMQLGDRKVVYALCGLFAPVLMFLAQQDLNEIWQANARTLSDR